MEQLPFLTDLTILLIVGIVCTVLAKKLQISNVLLLILAGIGLTQIPYPERTLFQFPPAFLTIIATITLVIVLFDSSARFKWKIVDQVTGKALKLATVFLIVNAFLLSIAVSYIFEIKNLFLILIFSATMAATSADVSLTMLKKYSTHKIVEILRIESIINTPLTVLIPFIIIDLMKTIKVEGSLVIITTLFEQLKPFITQFVAGIGAGVLVGLILGKIIKQGFNEKFSPLILLTAALLTYVLAENLGGNGVLAVTVMGLFFGNYYIKQNDDMYSFSTLFGNILMILVFMLVGIGMKINTISKDFFVNSLILFGIYLIIRLLCVYISFSDDNYNFKEKLFMTVNMPKGIAVATVAFALAAHIAAYPEMTVILDLIVLFILYSIFLSTLFIRFGDYFPTTSSDDEHATEKKKSKIISKYMK